MSSRGVHKQDYKSTAGFKWSSGVNQFSTCFVINTQGGALVGKVSGYILNWFELMNLNWFEFDEVPAFLLHSSWKLLMLWKLIENGRQAGHSVLTKNAFVHTQAEYDDAVRKTKAAGHAFCGKVWKFLETKISLFMYACKMQNDEHRQHRQRCLRQKYLW